MDHFMRILDRILATSYYMAKHVEGLWIKVDFQSMFRKCESMREYCMLFNSSWIHDNSLVEWTEILGSRKDCSQLAMLNTISI